MALTQVNTKGITDATVANADLANEAVNEAKIQISNAGTNGQYLQKQSGNTGGLTWADVPAGVGGATGVDFNDNVKIRSGTGNDLEIFHDGSHSYIDSSTGELQIRGAYIRIRDKDAGETMATFDDDGAVELYYDNSKKLETTSGGVKVSGALQLNDGHKIHFGTDEDLEIVHDGTNGEIKNKTGYLGIYPKTGEMGVKILPDANVELYFDNSKKLETTNVGVSVTGSITPSSGIYLGGSGGGNHMDDYEEGTWTGVIATGGGTVNNTWYTKIGNTVFVTGQLSAWGDTTSSTAITVTGLPFTCSFTSFGKTKWCKHEDAHKNPWCEADGTTVRFLKSSTSTGSCDYMYHSGIVQSSGSAAFGLWYNVA